MYLVLSFLVLWWDVLDADGSFWYDYFRMSRSAMLCNTEIFIFLINQISQLSCSLTVIIWVSKLQFPIQDALIYSPNMTNASKMF